MTMKKLNVVILVIDTLREDHGQGLEKLRELGFIRYSNAVAPAPWTLPSHVSMVTGLYPSQHGIHEAYGVYVDKQLPEISRMQMRKLNHGIMGELMSEGYSIYIISANAFLSPYYGFDKYTESMIIDYPITDKVRNYTELLNRNKLVKSVHEKGYLGTVKELIKNGHYSLLLFGLKTFILRRVRIALAKLNIVNLTMDKGAYVIKNIVETLNPEEPFFMLINIMEAHGPYTNKDIGEGISFNAFYRAMFDGVIDEEALSIWRREYPKHANYAIKRAIEIVHALKANLDNTLFIVTSDHGELLGDGGIFHGYFLKDGLLKVPLWVKYPTSFKPFKQTKPFISLTSIPTLIKAVLNNEEDYEVGTNMALAESFGSTLPSRYEEQYRKLPTETIIRVFSHRVRIYSRKCTFTYNLSTEEVEDGECMGQEPRKMMEIIKSIINTGTE
ncbi:sulfatase-like hydrolase/transferase [Vulcanisaeta thermophila]|uniref:sulfatase-like hydrolase/transferase n=1 Tax=Vulcanisaeta thermophila TaxID=867917 RepID=UPI0009FC73AC|nr:sulfatase-like hydrolase/transferase [Vulcanisaeta thermophila]